MAVWFNLMSIGVGAGEWQRTLVLVFKEGLPADVNATINDGTAQTHQVHRLNGLSLLAFMAVGDAGGDGALGSHSDAAS